MASDPPLSGEPLPPRDDDLPAWAKEADAVRRRLQAEAADRAAELQRESAKRGEELSRAARDKVDAALAEASSFAGLGAQSAETLSLLARDKTRELVKGSQEDVLRWQAAVVSSVESRVLEEFDAFVVELEPALRKSGRRAALEAMGFLGRKWSPTREVAEEARRVGDAEHLERLERFEKLVVQPVLTPFKRGLMEPVFEKAPVALGVVGAYTAGCIMLGAWIGGRRGRDGGNRGGGGGGGVGGGWP